MGGGAEQLRFRIDGREAVLVRRRKSPSLASTLSESERAIAQLALHGHSNREIAEHRGTSANTVSNQLCSAYRKLGIRSRGELAAALSNDPD